MDASGYTEIATVGTDGRMVLDLAIEPSDSLLAVATVEPHELASSSVRIYKIGAQQPQVRPPSPFPPAPLLLPPRTLPFCPEECYRVGCLCL